MQLKKELIDYLDNTFGSDFFKNIKIPIKAVFGERVVYVLQEGKAAQRLSSSPEELNDLVTLASEIGGQIAEINPPVESGHKEPRLVDLPGWSICFDLPLKRYLDSPSPMPDECDIEWLFGLYFGHRAKKLVLIDLIMPQVKGIFSVDYDIDYDFIPSNRSVGSLFSDFCAELQNLKEEVVQRKREVRWIKLVQLEFERTIKTKLSEKGCQKRRL